MVKGEINSVFTALEAAVIDVVTGTPAEQEIRDLLDDLRDSIGDLP